MKGANCKIEAVLLLPAQAAFALYLLLSSWAGIAQSVQWLATGWTVRGSNTGGGEIFSSRPDRPLGLISLLYNRYRVSFLGVKRPGRGVDHPPPSSATVKERVGLYVYSPSGPSLPVLGRTLPLPSFGDSDQSIDQRFPVFCVCDPKVANGMQ
jgi:hypothetical protein